MKEVDILSIKDIRKITNLSIREFAKEYGISFSTYNNWEHGYRECPSYVIELLELAVKEDYEE